MQPGGKLISFPSAPEADWVPSSNHHPGKAAKHAKRSAMGINQPGTAPAAFRETKSARCICSEWSKAQADGACLFR